MELPHIGKNCALSGCNQLDFLPVKCDACSEVFCVQHYQYDNHTCEKAKNKDAQVPVCPLCSQPVASRRDQLPDIAVSQHMDQFCPNNEAIKNRRIKPKTNLQACSFKSCKQKDLIYLECSDCKSKFCIKHRHPTDHTCPGPSMAANLADSWQSFKGSCSSGASSSFGLLRNKAQQISKSGQAALNRMTQNRSTSSRDAVNTLQGGLSEQEALQLALNQSKQTINNGNANNLQQEDEDLALARALHESQIEAQNRGTRKPETCVLS